MVVSVLVNLLIRLESAEIRCDITNAKVYLHVRSADTMDIEKSVGIAVRPSETFKQFNQTQKEK